MELFFFILIHFSHLQLSQLKGTPQDSINKFVIGKLLGSSLHSCLGNEQWIHPRGRYEISTSSVFLNLV